MRASRDHAAREDARVVSLIASATEIVCALGLRRRAGRPLPRVRLPGRRRAPARAARRRSSRSRAAAPRSTRACAQIVRDGLSVYRVDGEALQALEPDVIVTQDQCEVCAVSLADVEAATCTWTGRPVRDRLAEARLAGRRLRRHPPRRRGARRAERGRRPGRRHAGAASPPSAHRVAGRPRPRVAFVEWVEPLMAGGNWMPELIEVAGGVNLFGEAGKHSDWMQWDELAPPTPT